MVCSHRRCIAFRAQAGDELHSRVWGLEHALAGDPASIHGAFEAAVKFAHDHLRLSWESRRRRHYVRTDVFSFFWMASSATHTCRLPLAAGVENYLTRIPKLKKASF